MIAQKESENVAVKPLITGEVETVKKTTGTTHNQNELDDRNNSGEHARPSRMTLSVVTQR